MVVVADARQFFSDCLSVCRLAFWKHDWRPNEVHFRREYNAFRAYNKLPVVRQLFVSPSRLQIFVGERRQESLVVVFFILSILRLDKATKPPYSYGLSRRGCIKVVADVSK